MNDKINDFSVDVSNIDFGNDSGNNSMGTYIGNTETEKKDDNVSSQASVLKNLQNARAVQSSNQQAVNNSLKQNNSRVTKQQSVTLGGQYNISQGNMQMQSQTVKPTSQYGTTTSQGNMQMQSQTSMSASQYGATANQSNTQMQGQTSMPASQYGTAINQSNMQMQGQTSMPASQYGTAINQSNMQMQGQTSMPTSQYGATVNQSNMQNATQNKQVNSMQGMQYNNMSPMVNAGVNQQFRDAIHNVNTVSNQQYDDYNNNNFQGNIDDDEKEKLSIKDKIIIYSLIIVSVIILLITATMFFNVFIKRNNSTENKDNQQSSIHNSGVEKDKNLSGNNELNNDDINDDINDTVINNNSDKITMVFGGDVLLSESMINTYNKNGGKITNIMEQNLLDEFKKADIAMINQEFPFSTRGEAMADKQYTFRTDPMYAKIFNDMNLSIVSLANNHILDYGTDALLDTFSTLNDYKIMYSGAGRNLTEAKETKYIKVNDVKMAFFSASRVIPVSSWGATGTTPGVFTTYDSTALINEIKVAESNADLSIVYVHWGVEHAERPEDYQINMAKQYIDAGADVVIGCHTHCLQGMEYYNGKPIVYSMGNFIFGGNIDRTMMLKVEVDDKLNIKTQVKPCVSSSYCTRIVEDEKSIEDFYSYYSSISYGVDFGKDGYVLN